MRVAPLPVRLLSATMCALVPAMFLWLTRQEAPSLSVYIPMGLAAVTAPLIGAGLWRVQRRAWIALQVYAFLAVGVGLSHIMVYPEHSAPVLAMLSLIGGCTLFLWQQKLRRPFLAIDGRGFRRTERFEIDLACQLMFGESGSQGIWQLTGNTIDLSEGGVYVACDPAALQLDQRCMFDVKVRNHHLRTRARVAAIFPEGVGPKPRGIGLEFLNLVPTDHETILALVRTGRRHQRAPVQLPIEVSLGARTVQLNTLNLSRGGCFVADPDHSFQPGDQVMFSLSLHPGDEIEGFAEVAWAPEDERMVRPAGFALQFQKMTKEDLQRLKERLADFGDRD